MVQLRRWSEAVSALQPALADPSVGAEPWCLLAQCQLGMDQHRQARRSAGRAIAADPDQEWGHRLLAIALARAGKRASALRVCREALRLRPGGVHALHLYTELRLSQRRRRTAERLAQQNLEQNPNEALAWETAARVALARRRWAEAENRARRGLSLDPSDADLAMLLGRALDKQGRRAEAGEAYAAAARSDPTDHRPRRALGRIGIPAVAGGLIGLKLLPLLFLSLLRGFVALMALPPLWVGLAVAAVLGGWYGVTEILFRRASRQLSPQLRVVAIRQRRQDARPWLAAVIVISAALGLRAALGQDWPALVAFSALLAGSVALRRRLPKPAPAWPVKSGARWWARVAHSIRRRLR